MLLESMYASWLSETHIISMEERKLILRFSLKTENVFLARNTVNKNFYTLTTQEKIELHELLVSSSARAAAITAFLFFYKNDVALSKKFVSATSPDILVSILTEGVNAAPTSGAFLKECWSKNDTGLRLEVLKAITSQNKNDCPLNTWTTWLLENYGSKAKNGFAKDYWEKLLTVDASIWLWDTVSESNDAQTFSFLYIHSGDFPSCSQTKLFKKNLLRQLQTFKATADLELIIISEAYLKSIQGLDYEEVLPGTVSFELGSTLLKILEEFNSNNSQSTNSFLRMISSVRDSLRQAPKVAKLVNKGMPEKVMLAELSKGKFPKEALTLLQQGSITDNDLYRAIAESPLLPINAFTTSNVHTFFKNLPLDSILKNKSDDWVIKLLVFYWHAFYKDEYPFIMLVKKLPEHIKNAALLSVLDSAPSAMRTFKEMDILPNELLLKLKVSVLLSHADKAIWFSLKSKTIEFLESNDALWEVFSALADSFTGTYEELLNAVTLCVE